jgi:hypothetical protein
MHGRQAESTEMPVMQGANEDTLRIQQLANEPNQRIHSTRRGAPRS